MILRVNDNGTLKMFNFLDDSVVADVFDSTQAYAVGDYVFYGNSLYRFTSAHSAGAWNSSEVTAVTVTEEIESVKSALPTTQTVSGSTPSITGVADTRYICGECSTLAITAPASGMIDVQFESGSTATVLTVTSAKTGVSAIKWANGFDPTSLDASTTYELNILDGEYGVACSWT